MEDGKIPFPLVRKYKCKFLFNKRAFTVGQIIMKHTTVVGKSETFSFCVTY